MRVSQTTVDARCSYRARLLGRKSGRSRMEPESSRCVAIGAPRVRCVAGQRTRGGGSLQSQLLSLAAAEERGAGWGRDRGALGVGGRAPTGQFEVQAFEALPHRPVVVRPEERL